MPKRVKQHQVEDISRSKFNLLIPRNWVCRDKYKDYGIDIEVEIFDDEGRTTGIVFWVQLKATDSNDDAYINKIYLKIDSVKYYRRLDIPVLIVRYSEKQDRFYYKWAYEIDMFYAKEKAINIRISFSNEDILDKNSLINVKNFIQNPRN